MGMQEQSLFIEALEIEDPAERTAFLDRVCATDPILRQRLERLLKRHGQADSFLESPAANLPCPPRGRGVGGEGEIGTIDNTIVERPGIIIGPYKLLEEIGEGGFGLVFMAEQQQPVRRKVALKVIKPGMDSRHVVARFEAERQALALMDHPNIARVFDGGETANGRPFFVMELVKGVAITDYCDQNQLTPRERLKLFLHVCQAVQHAHHKGIIHRDLKPSNVLVTMQDGEPVVKVIDFGIAKALGQQLTDKTLFTNFAQMIGTPLYMSPEQAALSNVDIDTRSDVYSLGVLLYELLTGTTPFEKDRLKEVDYDEMRRVVREEEPPKPSTRISTLGQAADTVCMQRKSDPRRLRQLFRGDLDWIAMKALEKDRNRRYQTASSLAADVHRYLADEPVEARAPSSLYRFRKFARRNKVSLAVATSVLVLILLLAGSAIRFDQQKAARQAQTERAVMAALGQAQTLLDEGDKQTDYPERWETTARLAQTTLEKAEELLAAGTATRELAGRVQQARAGVDAAVTDSRLLARLDQIRLEQASVKIRAGNYDKARAAPLYAELLADYGVNISDREEAAARVRDSRLRDALLVAMSDWRRITPDERERQRLVEVLSAAEPPDALRARWRAAAGRRDAAELVRLTKDPALQRLGPAAVVDLALDLQEMKEGDAAERLLRAAQERNPGDFWLNHDLGRVLLFSQPSTGAEEAVGFLRVALALRSDSALVHQNLAAALNSKRDFDGAIREFQSALQIDPKSADAHLHLGYLWKAKGEGEKAISEFDAAIRECREAIRLDPKDATTQCNLGVALWEKGDLDAAFREFQSAVRISPNLAMAHNYLGLVLQRKGRLDDAISEFREAVRFDAISARNHLAGALYDNHDLDGAIREWQAAVRADPKDAVLHSNLGVGLAVKGDLEGAIREYREAIRLDPKDTGAQVNLATLAAAGKDQEKIIQEVRTAIRVEPELTPARQYFLGAWAWRLATNPDPGARDPRRAVELAKEAIENASKGVYFFGTLGVAYYRTGEYPAAITELEKSIKLRGNEGARASAIEAFFLAMAHWRLGDEPRARQWYDRAVEWTDKNHLNPREEELRRFRAEAAGVLGLPDPPGPAKGNEGTPTKH
jgi:serine/threonine protein kinase/tetratricopeptide (TPR) repeat protein